MRSLESIGVDLTSGVIPAVRHEAGAVLRGHGSVESQGQSSYEFGERVVLDDRPDRQCGELLDGDDGVALLDGATCCGGGIESLASGSRANRTNLADDRELGDESHASTSNSEVVSLANLDTGKGVNGLPLSAKWHVLDAQDATLLGVHAHVAAALLGGSAVLVGDRASCDLALVRVVRQQEPEADGEDYIEKDEDHEELLNPIITLVTAAAGRLVVRHDGVPLVLVALLVSNIAEPADMRKSWLCFLKIRAVVTTDLAQGAPVSARSAAELVAEKKPSGTQGAH